jgi:chromate transporter
MIGGKIMFKCIQLLWMFFKIGLFSFGGGYAMLPMIYKEIETLQLMDPREFSDLVALSQMTPGPIAVNAASYVGYKSSGFWGSVFATIGVSLPCFILILIVSAFLSRFKTSSVLQAVLKGIRPATVGMIASAVIFFAETSIYNGELLGWEMFKRPLEFISIPSLLIFAATIIATKKLKMGPITLTILAGIAGAFIL